VYIVDYNLETYVPIPRIGDAPVVHLDNLEELEVKVLWKDAVGSPLASLTAFAPDTIYQAEIEITPKAGYEFYPAQRFGYRDIKITSQEDDGGAVNRIITVIYKLMPDPKALDPAEDEDGDGFSNGYELTEGTNPMDPASHPGNSVSYESLSNFLGVTTVADAIGELHQRLNNGGSGGPYFDGLKLGMYLDLEKLDDSESSPIPGDDGNESLRIVIASFTSTRTRTIPKIISNSCLKTSPYRKKCGVMVIIMATKADTPMSAERIRRY
jgi:hypothetical protein